MRFREFLQRREIEEARDSLAEMDKAKSRFTANVHHELRTPLTLMLAPLEALRTGEFGELPPQIAEMLRTMHGNGLRLLKLINNLLDLAKVESEQLTVTRVETDLGRLVAEVVDGARSMAQRKGLALTVEGFDDLGPAFVDPDAIEKIIVNLLGNALKFTDQGSIRVAASATTDGGVHLQVADTGLGIPPDQLEKVFDRFAQVDASATRRHEGTGIGLSLVHELVRLHGGRVWAQSGGDGLGTTMHVELPVGQADASADEEVLLSDDAGRALSASRSFEALSSEDYSGGDSMRDAERSEMERTAARSEPPDGGLAALPSHPLGTPEVVIAEDNPEMRRLLAFLVGREFAVRPFRNGREALEAVRARPPELVLTDVMMPEMSGTELCAAIKGDEATRGVPVMLVTSKAQREMKIEGLERGADDYVTKPFHPRELLARVRSLVRVSQLQREISARNASLARANGELASALTELKDTQVQLVQSERLAAVGELSAGVAHEVNNPLNFARNSLATLRVYVDDLRGIVDRVVALELGNPLVLARQLEELERDKGTLDVAEMAESLTELVDIVTEGLDRTSRLVGDLRDFAAPGRGSRGPVDLAAGLRSTLQLVRARAREAGATLEESIPAGLPAVVADRGALNQVFLNLLKNAVEAIEGTGGTIRVDAAAEDGVVRIRFSDDGPGISAEASERLFEPFFTTKPAGQGSGLGLSICRRIVSDAGGRIHVESAAGQGTTVIVELPIARGGEEARAGA